jgi:hypothetical protein
LSALQVVSLKLLGHNLRTLKLLIGWRCRCFSACGGHGIARLIYPSVRFGDARRQKPFGFFSVLDPKGPASLGAGLAGRGREKMLDVTGHATAEIVCAVERLEICTHGLLLLRL